MKKYIISAIVIIAIIAYVFYLKMSDSNPAVVDSTPAPVNSRAQYKDGIYTGQDIKFLYGNMQVQATVTGGKLADVSLLVYPNDNRTSAQINETALPVWRTEVVTTQQTKVNVISGATDSGVAFTKSLESALSQANS